MPCAPSKLNRDPPTTAPTMPRAMSRKKPLPLLLTILLDMTGNNAAAFSRVSELASVPNDRGGNQPSISDDGRFIAFTSVSNFDPTDTNGAADVYRRDMTGNNAAAFSRVSGLASVPNDRGGNQPSISANGRFVVFISASNFDPNDTNNADDAYRRDMCP